MLVHSRGRLSLISLDVNVCFVLRCGLESAESARGNRLQSPLSVESLMNAIKVALHRSLLIAHWSLVPVLTTARSHTALLVRSFLWCRRTNATRARITAGLTSARCTQDACKALARKVGIRSEDFPFWIPVALKNAPSRCSDSSPNVRSAKQLVLGALSG